MDEAAARASALATFFDDHLLDMLLDHERKLGIIRSVTCSLRCKANPGEDEVHKRWPGPEHTAEDAEKRYTTIRVNNCWRQRARNTVPETPKHPKAATDTAWHGNW